MRKSESIAKVAAALAAAQADLQNVVADSINPHFKSRYASLPAILDTVRPVIAKHGLAVLQLPVSIDGRIGIETTILHSSGEYISELFTVALTKNDAQGAGSAITYCRRYSLTAALAIGQEDDDGQAAKAAPKKRPPRNHPDDDLGAGTVPPEEGMATQRELRMLFAKSAARAEELGDESIPGGEILKAVARQLGYTSRKDIPRSAVDRIAKMVEGWSPPVGED